MWIDVEQILQNNYVVGMNQRKRFLLDLIAHSHQKVYIVAKFDGFF